MIVADMELMIDDVAHVVFTCTLGTQTPRSKHVKKKILTSHCGTGSKYLIPSL